MDFNYRSYLKSLLSDIPVSEKLTKVIHKIADIITNEIGYELMRLLYEVNISKAIDTSSLLDYNRDIYHVLRLIIEQGIEQGQFKKDLSSSTIAIHIVLALRGLTYEWCVRYPDFEYKTHCIEHIQMLIEGIQTKEN